MNIFYNIIKLLLIITIINNINVDAVLTQNTELMEISNIINNFNTSCVSDIDCAGYSECVNNECLCIFGYSTLNSSIPCVYKQKDKSAVLLLQVFNGFFGVADFYTNHNKFGLLKLTFQLIVILVGMCKSQAILTKKKINNIMCVLQVGIIIWWIIDIARISNDYYLDNNDQELV